jgi:hypothetical protein
MKNQNACINMSSIEGGFISTPLTPSSGQTVKQGIGNLPGNKYVLPSSGLVGKQE